MIIAKRQGQTILLASFRHYLIQHVFTWSQKKGHLSSKVKHTYSEVPEVSNFDS